MSDNGEGGRKEGNKRGPANKSVSIFNFSASKLGRNCSPHSLSFSLYQHFVTLNAFHKRLVAPPSSTIRGLISFQNGGGNKPDTCKWRVAQFKKLMHVSMASNRYARGIRNDSTFNIARQQIFHHFLQSWIRKTGSIQFFNSGKRKREKKI